MKGGYQMKRKNTYAIFGLGRYGRSVAKELVSSGAEVLAVDMDEEVVRAAISEIPICKCANVTDSEVIKQLGISNFDVVVIAMASCLEASVMATMLCKEAGVKKVIAKCSSEMNCKILEKVGADSVVFPESESGIRLAKNLISSGFIDLIELSSDVSIVEIEVKNEWIGKNLIELDLRRKYFMNVVAVRDHQTIKVNINPELPLTNEMKLIVIAETSSLNALKNH